MRLTGIAPLLIVGAIITPGTGSISTAGVPPSNDRAIVSQAGSLSLSGYAPSVSEGLGSQTITPDPGALSVSGVAGRLDFSTVFRDQVTVTDDFNRADEDPIDPPWYPIAGYTYRAKISGNKMMANGVISPDGTDFADSYHGEKVYGPAQFGQFVYNTGKEPYIWLRAQASGSMLNGYLCRFYGGGGDVIRFIDNGQSPSLGGFTQTLQAGDVLRFEVDNKFNFSVIVNGKTVGTAIDPLEAHPTGFPGPRVHYWTGEVDDWFGGDDSTLRLRTYAPTIRTNNIIQPSTGSLSAEGVAPSTGIVEATIITPDTGSLLLVGSIPQFEGQIIPTKGALSLAGIAPVLKTEFFITPASGSLSVLGEAPSLLEKNIVAPDTGQLSLSGIAPSQGVSVCPGTGELSAAGAVPGIINYVIVVPGTGGLSLTGVAPLSSAEKQITPSTGSLSLTEYGPNPLRLTMVPPAGALSLSGKGISIERDGDLYLTPACGNLSISGGSPGISPETFVPAGSLSLSGASPILNRAIRTSSGSLSTGGVAPSVSESIVTQIPTQTGQLAIAGGDAPSFIHGTVVQPDPGSIAARGEDGYPFVGLLWTKLYFKFGKRNIHFQ